MRVQSTQMIHTPKVMHMCCKQSYRSNSPSSSQLPLTPAWLCSKHPEDIHLKRWWIVSAGGRNKRTRAAVAKISRDFMEVLLRSRAMEERSGPSDALSSRPGAPSPLACRRTIFFHVCTAHPHTWRSTSYLHAFQKRWYVPSNESNTLHLAA